MLHPNLRGVVHPTKHLKKIKAKVITPGVLCIFISEYRYIFELCHVGYWGADAAQFFLSGTSVVFVRGIVLRDGPGRVSYHTQHLVGKKIVLGLPNLTFLL
jgi:hypothetical protein